MRKWWSELAEWERDEKKRSLKYLIGIVSFVALPFILVLIAYHTMDDCRPSNYGYNDNEYTCQTEFLFFFIKDNNTDKTVKIINR